MAKLHYYQERAKKNQGQALLTSREYRARALECQQEIREKVDHDDWRGLPWCEPLTEHFVESVSKAQVFVDIGAEAGFYSYLALKHMPANSQIFAFEPNPILYQALTDFFAPYQNVTVFSFAVGDSHGCIEMTKPAGLSVTCADVEGEKIQTQSIVLDQFFKGKKIDVIKIDIEGGEGFAFKGMQDILARGETKIYLELHYWVDDLLPGATKFIEDSLKKANYLLYSLDSGASVPLSCLKGTRFYLSPDPQQSVSCSADAASQAAEDTVKENASEQSTEDKPCELAKTEPFMIDELILDWTRLCNSRCTYCSIWQIKNPPQLSMEAVENIFKARQMSQLRSCFLTGGEPYISDDAVEIARLLKKYIPGAFLAGATNAIQVDKTFERIMKIRDLGVRVDVQISINGSQETHDATRGKNGFWDKCCELIDKLQAECITMSAVFSVMPQTIKDLPYIQRFCEARGIGLEIVWVRQAERYSTVDQNYTTWPEEIKSRLKVIENLPDYFDCPALTKRLAITPEGEVYPCEVYEPALLLGNVNEKSLEEILDAPRAYSMKKMIQQRGCHWCQGPGEYEGNPKWMVMDCYRRQSPQALEVRGQCVEARYLPPTLSAQVVDELLAPITNLRPETADLKEIDRAIEILRNRARERFV